MDRADMLREQIRPTDQHTRGPHDPLTLRLLAGVAC